MAGGSTKVILISLCANFCIALTKFAGSVYTGSAALLAEAVHSFSDCGNQGLLLFGQRQAALGPSKQYPLGRGKELFFWSFVVALLLFSMGGVFSLYEGIHKIQEPTPVNFPWLGIAILLVAIALEGYAFFACLKEVKKKNRRPSLWVWIRDTTSVDLLVIFLEDAAALLGLCLALVALLLSWYTGNGVWDGIGSCAIGVLLIVVAVILAREVKSMLIGERPSRDYREDLEQMLQEALPGAELMNLIATQQGVDSVMMIYDIHPGTDTCDFEELTEKVNKFKHSVSTRFPEIKRQFIELDTVADI